MIIYRISNNKKIISCLVIIKKYNYFRCNYKCINNYYHGQFYYLIKRIKSSAFIDCKCFLRFNKYKIVGKGWVKCTKV